jgi:murein DD-endopeptidase MepM/ murein hydrolase activator NlpD
VVAAVVFAPPAAASGNAGIAALQVALHARGLYTGTIDGLSGPATARAVKRFQRRAGLAADGIAGPRTRAALGHYGRHLLGSRPLTRGTVGWDVAALQFMLAWHGFPCATFDGGFGLHTDTAVRRFQRWAGLPVDGIAGAATVAALRRPPPRSPIRLTWPVQAPLGDAFGPRGTRFHAGLDLTAPAGMAVEAAAPGRVAFADFAAGGWGNLVIVVHTGGVTTRYAHLADVAVRPGQLVATGTGLGTVGATGNATGPHLHFEVRVRGAAVDPRPALP